MFSFFGQVVSNLLKGTWADIWRFVLPHLLWVISALTLLRQSNLQLLQTGADLSPLHLHPLNFLHNVHQCNCMFNLLHCASIKLNLALILGPLTPSLLKCPSLAATAERGRERERERWHLTTAVFYNMKIWSISLRWGAVESIHTHCGSFLLHRFAYLFHSHRTKSNLSVFKRI